MKEIEEIRSYCLNCKNSQCRIKGCPLGNCIPEFIHETDSKKAYEILCNTTILPAICGRICPHKKQCEGSCIRGIKGEPVSIGAMEAYIGDLSIENNYELSIEVDERAKDKSVAVIGSGPAGLTCAAFLARKGVKVTIYEKHDKLGGLLTHGIPEFRLPREVVEKTIEKILDLGVETKLNQELGRDFEIEDLAQKYDAVFVAIGANIPAKMNVEGEGLEGVYGGNYLLEYNKHPNYTGKKVAIIGGGNVAMDSARTIKKLGASEVYVIYRRAEEQMPAEKKEIEDAMVKVTMGPEKTTRVRSEKEKKLVAYHEAGHAVVSKFLPTQDPVHEISIVPRGMAGGYTMYRPTEDKSFMSKTAMEEQIISLLGGRVAEALILNDISTGASNDIERASQIARSMVTVYGMSPRLGAIMYGQGQGEVFLGRDLAQTKNYSEETAAIIDEEVKSIIDRAYNTAKEILAANIDKLHIVAGILLEKEKIDGEEFDRVFNS